MTTSAEMLTRRAPTFPPDPPRGPRPTPSAADTVVLAGDPRAAAPSGTASVTASVTGSVTGTVALPGDALAVLTLAQRTAEEHVAAAHRHAQELRDKADAEAEQVRREARAYAAGMRADAEKFLTDARGEAERIVAGGIEHAEQLRVRAERQFEDAVGGLSIKREALQRQIEDLAHFDNDYRHRITSFLQGQLRALWADRPRVLEGPYAESQMPGGPVPASSESASPEPVSSGPVSSGPAVSFGWR